MHAISLRFRKLPQLLEKIALTGALAFLLTGFPLSSAQAQTSPTAPNLEAPPAPAKPAPAQHGFKESVEETVEADVSTHSIAVTSGFSGTKIIIFGAINRPSEMMLKTGLYDVIVVVQGQSLPIVARKKSNILGLWVNTGSVRMDSAPSYYTLASTRPIDQIADSKVLALYEIGFENIDIKVGPRAQAKQSSEEIANYQDAIIRLKRKSDLYQIQERGVRFIGHSLFRSSFDLPANVPVGPLKASVYLFRNGTLRAQFRSQVELRREGLQRVLYNLAFNYPLLYGILAVVFAAIAGLSASAIFGRNRH